MSGAQRFEFHTNSSVSLMDSRGVGNSIKVNPTIQQSEYLESLAEELKLTEIRHSGYEEAVVTLVNKRLNNSHKDTNNVWQNYLHSNRTHQLIQLQGIQLYGLTIASEYSDGEQMYEEITAVKAAKFLKTIGDFNTKVGHFINYCTTENETYFV